MGINGFGAGGFAGRMAGGNYASPRMRAYIPNGSDFAMARGAGGGFYNNSANMGMGYAMMNTMMPCMFAGGMLPLFLLGGGLGFGGGMPCGDITMAM